MIKQTAIILVLLLSFPTIATAEPFVGADGKASCIAEDEVMTRFNALQSQAPLAMITIDADEEQYKHVLAAINTVLGVGHEIHASHFQTVFMPGADGRKSAMVMYGDQADQFCNFVIFTADQVEEVSKLMKSTGI
jgi:hypothetical protein